MKISRKFGTSDFPLEVLPSKSSICRTYTSLILLCIVVYSEGMHLYKIVTDLFAFLILINFRKFNKEVTKFLEGFFSSDILRLL